MPHPGEFSRNLDDRAPARRRTAPPAVPGACGAPAATAPPGSRARHTLAPDIPADRDIPPDADRLPDPDDLADAPADLFAAGGPGGRMPELTSARMRRMGKAEARAVSDALFERLAGLDPADPAHGEVRATLVELNLTLVRWVAARYRHRGEPMEDITQAGVVGLVKAVDAYDPGRGTEFASYAIPTISGEIKRFFRDTTWPVHVPRSAQELYLSVVKASDALEQDLGRAPTARQIAERLRVGVDEVEEGRRTSRACVTGSLEEQLEPEDGAPLAERLGTDEAGFALVEFRESVRPLIEALPERERYILRLRFWEDLTQREIADRIGVSQMHVSRLLAATMDNLRRGLLSDHDPSPGAAAGAAGTEPAATAGAA